MLLRCLKTWHDVGLCVARTRKEREAQYHGHVQAGCERVSAEGSHHAIEGLSMSADTASLLEMTSPRAKTAPYPGAMAHRRKDAALFLDPQPPIPPVALSLHRDRKLRIPPLCRARHIDRDIRARIYFPHCPGGTHAELFTTLSRLILECFIFGIELQCLCLPPTDQWHPSHSHGKWLFDSG